MDGVGLEGPLKISALEQVRFLTRLVTDQLPVSKEVQATVREMICIEEGDDWALYAKTGWAGNIGWWVGWVEKEGDFHAFALNMDILQDEDAGKRQIVAKKCLEVLGIIGD